jgi:hypothetical protein
MPVMFFYVVTNLSLVFHAYDVMLLLPPSSTTSSVFKVHCALSLSLSLSLSEFIQMLSVMITSY